jgi:hypothetical protein
MKRDTRLKRILVVSAAGAALALVPLGGVIAAAAVQRTVYFSAVDANGAPVTDLTAADFVVKEGGKERTIDAVEPATEPIQAVLLVDDAGSGAFQAGVARFLETTQGKAEVAITVLEPQPMKVTGFTSNFDEFKAAISRIGPRGKVVTVGEQIMGAVDAAAKDLMKRKAVRPAIVVMTAGGEQTQSNEADPALDTLKASGASLHVVYVTGLGLGKVLGDGPKQSGGMSQQVGGGVPLGPVLEKVAQNLLHQYKVTYTLPDGVKPSDRFALTTTRKSVTLLAPSKVPTK